MNRHTFHLPERLFPSLRRHRNGFSGDMRWICRRALSRFERVFVRPDAAEFVPNRLQRQIGNFGDHTAKSMNLAWGEPPFFADGSAKIAGVDFAFRSVRFRCEAGGGYRCIFVK
jgi:hypothetical protein